VALIALIVPKSHNIFCNRDNADGKAMTAEGRALHDRADSIANRCMQDAVRRSDPWGRLAMNTEWSKSVIRQAGQAIYEADPTLRPFDDLPEEEKTDITYRRKRYSNLSRVAGADRK